MRAFASLKRHPTALIISVSLLAYAAIAAVMMGPVLVHCTTTVFGPQPGDGTAGGVWTSWEFTRLGSPFAATTPDIAAPQGRAFFLPDNVASLVVLLPQWVEAHIAGPICSWNLTVYSGFVLDGLAVFGMVRWLTRRPFVAFIAGCAYAFTPFHIEAAYGHPDLVHSWPLVLVMWAMLALIQRPTWRRALLAGASVALAGYGDGYYLLFAPVLAVTLAVAGAAWWLRKSSWRLSAATRFPAMAGIAALSGATLMAPIAYLFLHSAGTLAVLLTRARADIYTYAARPLEYLLPSHTHPVFGPIVAGFETQYIQRSNFSEASLYVGDTVLLLALGFVLIIFVSRRWRARSTQLALPPLFLAVTMVALAGVAAILSAGGLPRTVTTPADLIYDVIPFWRDYSRFFLVVDLAVVVLAALALCMLPRTRRGGAALTAALLIIGFDLLALPPWQVWSYPQRVPAIYQWIAQRPPNTIIAEYPIGQPGFPADEAYLTYQVVHQRRIINAALPGTARYGLELGVAELSGPQTLPVLRALGVRYVLIHDNLYAQSTSTPPVVPGLHQVVSEGGVTVYEIDPGPTAQYAITLNQGFTSMGLSEPAAATYLFGPGEMGIWSFSGSPPPLQISFDLNVAGTTGLTITQDGRTVWAGMVPGTATVRFELRNPKDPIVLTMDRQATLGFANLLAVPSS